ncbi:MAG: major capsid protein [Aquabacterium sp.]
MKKLMLATAAAVATAAANAAVDPSVTTAITGAQTDAITVVTALTVMGATIWGATYIYRKFFR